MKALTAISLALAAALAANTSATAQTATEAYASHYSAWHDDAAQYLPAASTLLLKSLGAESRSDWDRMLVSEGLSAALMVSAVELTKRGSSKSRPDGDDNRSMPSGHTAIAFMGATMLHKEYGHISPWISVGGYSAATAVAVSRVASNRHWPADVVAGACIGIVSVELGYFLTDLIFNDKGLADIDGGHFNDRWHTPSFLGLYGGYTVCGSSLNTEAGKIGIGSGVTAGVEGAAFLTAHLGLGGRAEFSDMTLELDGTSTGRKLERTSALAGVYASYPFSRRLQATAKLLGGIARYSSTTVGAQAAVAVGGLTTGAASAGIALAFIQSSSVTLRLGADYTTTGSFIQSSSRPTRTLTISSSISAAF